jgi:hypothetical protein
MPYDPWRPAQVAKMFCEERMAWWDRRREEARQQADNAQPWCALHQQRMHVCGGRCAECLNTLWGMQQPCVRLLGSARHGSACRMPCMPRARSTSSSHPLTTAPTSWPPCINCILLWLCMAPCSCCPKPI